MDLKLNRYRKYCEELNNKKPVFIPELDPKNSTGVIEVLFINERPGPKTTGTKIVSFDNPDPSAKLFKELFEKVFGIEYRKNILITNAIIWVPDTNKPKNHEPKKKDLRDPTNLLILKDQIENVKPKIIVSLGESALYSLWHLYGRMFGLRKFVLKDVRGRLIKKNVPIPIYPVYHTSALAQRTRNKKQQLRDWTNLRKEIIEINKK